MLRAQRHHIANCGSGLPRITTVFRSKPRTRAPRPNLSARLEPQGAVQTDRRAVDVVVFGDVGGETRILVRIAHPIRIARGPARRSCASKPEMEVVLMMTPRWLEARGSFLAIASAAWLATAKAEFR